MLTALRISQTGHAKVGTLLAVSRGAVRYSSKKPEHPMDSKPEDPKEERLQRLEGGKPAPTQGTSKYMSFDQLPKPSKESQHVSMEHFSALMRMEKFEPALETKEAGDFKHDFKLSAENIIPKSQRSLDSLKVSDYTPNLAVLGIYQDTDTLASGLEDHPLKESLTGMCVLNPLLHEIKNKSLHKVFPLKDSFESPPFGEQFSFDSFKDWEASKNEKIKEAESKKLAEEKEFQKFSKSLRKSKSFVRKTSVPSRPKATQASSGKPEMVETSGRKKLDRSLVKQYRRYKKEQHQKGDTNNKENK